MPAAASRRASAPGAGYTVSAPWATEASALALAAAAPSSSSSASRQANVTAPWATEPASSSASVSRRPNFQYDLTDIEKAHSTSYVGRLLQLHPVPRSPLDPVYQLSRVVERPITPPRFLRDTLDVSDIERTRSRDPYHGRPARAQQSLHCRDIQGTAPLQRYATPSRTLTSLQAQDITHTRFVSQRHTDPLDPVYAFGRETNLDLSTMLGRVDSRRGGEEDAGSLIHFGAVAGSKARSGPRARQVENVLNLRTDDISSKEAAEWSWAKPARSLVRNQTDTHDIPGAQTHADLAKIHKLARSSPQARDPLTREYGHLGGSRVSDQAGMVHVHRHVLDDSAAASTWKPAQGEPAEDAAGVSLWRSGNFTAGTQYPRAKKSPPVEVAQPQQQRKIAFGAPAEDIPIRDEPQRHAPAAVQAPTQYRSSTPPSESASEPIYAPAVERASAPVKAAYPMPSAGDPAFLSYPIDTRKPPPAQKRHSSGHNVSRPNILASPPSDGREFAPVDLAASRVPAMLFGVRGPYGVPSEKATIQETQDASVPTSQAARRSNSRPVSGTSLTLGSGGESLKKTQTAPLQHLPFASSTTRPGVIGLGTTEMFLRKQCVLSWTKTQERKAATVRANEIHAVRALG